MTARPVLVLDAGSSSLKYGVVCPETGRSLTGGHVAHRAEEHAAERVESARAHHQQ